MNWEKFVESLTTQERVALSLVLTGKLSAGDNLPLDTIERELMRDGEKIKAIKMYRLRTGAGLKEAKDAVEREFPPKTQW